LLQSTEAGTLQSSSCTKCGGDPTFLAKRICELYAKLIGLLLQHWLIILFAQAGTNSAVWSSWHR